MTETQRLDLWLWHARFCKTRSIATRLVTDGRVRCAGTIVTKPHYAVGPDCVLTFPLGRHIRVIRVLALADRRGPAVEARTLYEDLDPPTPETALPKGPNPLPLLLPLLIAAVVAASPATGRDIAKDAWFQRGLDDNLRYCAVHSDRPKWCTTWIEAMEMARPKPTDLSLPEWQRTPFDDTMMVCTSLLPPGWCPAWHQAMAGLSLDSAYAEIAQALTAQRIKEEDARQAKAQAWTDALNHVASNRVSPLDLDLIRQRAADGDVTAYEVLGWIFLQGRGVRRDYARAYEFYGRAVLAGREDLRPNLDSIWPLMNETQKNEIRVLFK